MKAKTSVRCANVLITATGCVRNLSARHIADVALSLAVGESARLTGAITTRKVAPDRALITQDAGLGEGEVIIAQTGD